MTCIQSGCSVRVVSVATRFAISALLVWMASIALTGCGATPYSREATAGATGALHGNVHGGQQPVGGARIQLYAVGATGDGSASTPLLTATVTSSDGTGNAINANANAGNGFNSFPLGEFSITLDYSCPSSSTQVYLTATGGDPGIGIPTNNSALALLAFLGPCGSLTPNRIVNVNELTTVGSLASLGPYFGGLASIGSGSGDSAAFLTALNLVSSYTNTSTGSVPGPDLAPGYYASTLEVTTLADILAGCINSDGTTAVCQQLFTLATPPGQPAPTNAVDALGSILRNPELNVQAIFDLLQPKSPFQPVLAAAPTQWALPILPVAATPMILPASGSYSVAPQVTLSDSTPGATMYYTVDGSTPTTMSNVYLGPFTLVNSGATTRTVKAIATASGYGASDASSASYTLPPAGSASAIGFLTQPVTSAVATVLPPVKVGFVDAYGTPVAKSGKSITVAIGTNPVSGHLSGTLSGFSGSDGSVTFSNLQIGTVGSGYTLTAASSGYAAGTSTVFDITTPPIVINIPGALIGTSATLPGSFTLPTAAPAGGTTVTLTSSNTAGIAISPAAVALNAGDTTGSFTYTAVGTGSATLRATAPTYTDGTASVTTTASSISLGTLPALPLGSFQTLNVTLSQPAPVGGLSVALSSSNPSVLYVSSTANFAAGATTSSNSVQIEAQAFGTAQLTGTAAGYAPDARTVTLTASSSLTNVSVVRSSAVAMKLTLSQAPASSLSFTLKSDNTSVATVPGTVTLLAGQTSVNFNVTGSGVGTTTIRATASGLTEATGTATVTGTLTVTNGSPAAMLFVPATLNLASPAISPVSVTITSSNPAALLLSADSSTTGAASITLNNLTGALATFYEQGQTAGTSTLTITSTYFSTVTSTVTIYNSTVLVQPGFTGTLSTTAAPATVYVTLGELNGSTYLGPCTGAATSGINATSLGCKLNPGLTLSVPVVSGTPATGTITSSPVAFIAGQSNLITTFQPVGGGTSLISVGAQPTGFSAPSSTVSTTFTATVAKPSFTLTNAGTYAAGVTTPVSVAPSIADTSTDGATVTVASGNGSLALLSTDPAALGTPTLTLTGVHASVPTIYVQGLATGSTTLTISAPGYTTSSTTLTVGTGSVAFTSSANVNVNTADAPLAIGVVLNIGPGKLCYSAGVTTCFLSPGNNAQITLNSANTAIATSVSPFTMNAGTGFTTGSVSGVGAGSTVLQIVSASSPLVTPSFSYGPSQIGINVTQASVTAPAVSTGSNLYSPQTFVLAPAPGSTRPVTISSSDPTVAVISTSATTLGSGTATVPSYTSGSVAYYVQGLSPGTATLTIAAAGYTSKTSTITVLPSGVVFSPTSPATFSTTSFSQPTTVGLYVAMLNSATGAVANYCGSTCLPNPGATFSAPVISSNTTTGTLNTNLVTFPAGISQASITFLPGEVGTTVLSLGSQPAGQTSGTGVANAGVATVTGAAITMPNVLTGAGLYVSEAISMGANPPSAATLTVSVADPSLARLSTDPNALGTGSTLTFNNVTCLDTYCSSGGPPLFYVQGIAPGYTKLTITSHGYASGIATIAVYKAGLTLFSLSTQNLTGVLGNSTQPSANGRLSLLDPYSQSIIGDCNIGAIPCLLNPGGIAPSLTLATAKPAIGVFGLSTTFDPTLGSVSIPYTPLSQGQTDYTLNTQAVGYYNTTTPARKTGIASTTVSGSAGIQNSLFLLAHDIDAGVGVEVSGEFGYSATVLGYNTNPLTVTVADPTIAVVSTSASVAGSGSYSGTYTNFNNTFYVQGLKAGTTTITFSESQYISRTITVTVRPAGFVIKQFDSIAYVTNRTTSIAVLPAVLNAIGQWMANAQMNPQGSAATVAISSAAPAVGTVPATVTVNPGASSGTSTVQLVSAGASTFTLGAASAPLTTPTNYQSVTLTVR